MNRYIVTVKEVHERMVEVEAEDEEEAKDLVKTGDGIQVGETLHAYDLEEDAWTVESVGT